MSARVFYLEPPAKRSERFNTTFILENILYICDIVVISDNMLIQLTRIIYLSLKELGTGLSFCPCAFVSRWIETSTAHRYEAPVAPSSALGPNGPSAQDVPVVVRKPSNAIHGVASGTEI